MKIWEQVLSFCEKQLKCQNLKESPLQVKKSILFTNIVTIIHNAKPYTLSLPTCSYMFISNHNISTISIAAEFSDITQCVHKNSKFLLFYKEIDSYGM